MPRASRLAADPVAGSDKRPAASAVDPAIVARTDALLATNVGVTLPADPGSVLAMIRGGAAGPASPFGSGAQLFAYNLPEPTQKARGVVALVLNDAGKRFLASQAGPAVDALLSRAADPAAPARDPVNAMYDGGVSAPLRVALDLAKHVDHVLVWEEDFPALSQALDEAVAKEPALASVGGKPTRTLFRKSDDFLNDLELDAFRRSDPHWAARWRDLPPDAEKAAAALGARAVGAMPPEVPEPIRRRIAATLVSHRTVKPADLPSGLVPGDWRTFYHGTPFETSSRFPVERTIRDGMHVDDQIAYFGNGVYFGNPSVAGGYAGRPNERMDILGGQVAIGKLSPDKSLQTGFDSAHDVRKGFDVGDYWVTADPKRFRITSLTTLHPDKAEGLVQRLPDLIAAYAANPGWARGYLDRIPAETARRAYRHALGSPDPAIRQAAAQLLAAPPPPTGPNA